MEDRGVLPGASSSRAMAANSSNIHQSAKMMEAQAFFQRVVKQELQVLLSSGMEREVAVKVLLHRIVESTQEPEESDVRRVMKQFQMNHDDAVRALIVKQTVVDDTPGSPTAISARADDSLNSPDAPTSTVIGKRQRLTGSSSPLFDCPDEDEPVIHVTKRHRK
ncbi:hypothetical protein ATCC90586_005419 [Pythium insidiosum]|nr:hypothetical protein ATCC90586_005419 [Pythium insidiosum]